MLRLSISPELDTFRAEFAGWLAKNPPPSRSSIKSFDDFQAAGRAWQKKLSSGKWLGLHWPEAYGGRGLSLVEEAIVQEELVRADAPQILGLFGLTMVGPVLIKHGSAEQKSRYLARILTGADIWCQGFSEPAAGSDLAAIKTRAESVSNGFVVTGQKIWTSFAHVADYCFVLCRTSDEARRHDGLTYLLVSMKSPGIRIRPLKQISGDDEFNEVFFDKVEVPSENVVGAVGEGWKIAIATLMYERVVLTFARQLQSEVVLRQLLENAGKVSSSRLRARIGDAVVEACATRALAYRHLVRYAGGVEPGPEGSLDKLLWSESFQRLSALSLDCEGTMAAFGEGANEAVHRYLYSRGRTIAAGTSEIQRTIIAERLLDLPRLKLSR